MKNESTTVEFFDAYRSERDDLDLAIDGAAGKLRPLAYLAELMADEEDCPTKKGDLQGVGITLRAVLSELEAVMARPLLSRPEMPEKMAR